MPTRWGHDSIGMSQVTGFGCYFAGYRQGDGNTHIHVEWSWAIWLGTDEAKVTPSSTFSVYHWHATYYRDWVSAKQSHPYFYAPYIAYGWWRADVTPSFKDKTECITICMPGRHYKWLISNSITKKRNTTNIRLSELYRLYWKWRLQTSQAIDWGLRMPRTQQHL